MGLKEFFLGNENKNNSKKQVNKEKNKDIVTTNALTMATKKHTIALKAQAIAARAVKIAKALFFISIHLFNIGSLSILSFIDFKFIPTLQTQDKIVPRAIIIAIKASL